MGTIRVELKKLREDAKIPEYKTVGAAGFDFCAAIDEPISIEPGQWKNIPFGIAAEIPAGRFLLIRSRSGLAFNHHVFAYDGLIDSDYRGELSAYLHNFGDTTFVVEPGQRVAQGVIVKFDSAVFIESDTLSETDRGTSGFGSTGTL